MKKLLSRLSVFQVVLILPFLLSMMIMVTSCNHQPGTETTGITEKIPDSTKPKYTAAMVDNKKDPSCGMPVTAGIEDTVHYNGKVYGFCSSECKNAFLKDPAAMVKNADLK